MIFIPHAIPFLSPREPALTPQGIWVDPTQVVALSEQLIPASENTTPHYGTVVTLKNGQTLLVSDSLHEVAGLIHEAMDDGFGS